MKTGFLGCWGHYQTVLDEIDHMPGMEVGGLAPGVPGEDMTPLRKRYPQVLLYPEPDALLASGLFDLVIISTRLDRIPVLALQAAAAGCHSICEKPLALDRESLRSLWDQVAANGTQCVAMLHNRKYTVNFPADASGSLLNQTCRDRRAWQSKHYKSRISNRQRKAT